MIGATARELLTQPGFAGRVLAVVTGAVYLTGVIARSDFRDEAISNSQFGDCFAPLAMTSGEILWLARNDLPMHTRAWRGNFDFGALRAGMTFQSDGARLYFGAKGDHAEGDHTGSPLRFADAHVWQPMAIDPARVVPRETVIARIKDLTGFQKPDRSDLRALIGLGEGLTPSGDDFVGGWLFAAHHLRAVYGDALGWEPHTVSDLLEYARTRTNVISYTLLRDHARGQGMEPLHDLVAALLQGASAYEIESHTRRLRAIGSLTGENLLVGATTAILSLAIERRNNG